MKYFILLVLILNGFTSAHAESNSDSDKSDTRQNEGEALSRTASSAELLSLGNKSYESGPVGYEEAEIYYLQFVARADLIDDVPFVLSRLIQIRSQLKDCAECEPSSAKKIEIYSLALLKNWPGSTYESEAKKHLRTSLEALSEYEIRIGDFYLNRASKEKPTTYFAALERYRNALSYAQRGVQQEPELKQQSSLINKIYFKIATTYYKWNQLNDALENFLIVKENLNKLDQSNELKAEVDSFIAQIKVQIEIDQSRKRIPIR